MADISISVFQLPIIQSFAVSAGFGVEGVAGLEAGICVALWLAAGLVFAEGLEVAGLVLTVDFLEEAAVCSAVLGITEAAVLPVSETAETEDVSVFSEETSPLFFASLQAARKQKRLIAKNALTILLIFYIPNQKSAQPKPRTEKRMTPLAATQILTDHKSM